MFVPIPSAEVCDLSSRSSRYIAQTVARTWHTLDASSYHRIPARIDLRPDGTGTLSSPYTQHTPAGPAHRAATQEFTWHLGRDGPLGMEDIDTDALYGIMPKLMQATKAWTHRPWAADARIVPAYVRLALVGPHSLAVSAGEAVDDFVRGEEGGVGLPAELVEAVVELALGADGCGEGADTLLHVCKWTRERVLSRRRRVRFAALVERTARWGLAFWIGCGHFDPPGSPLTGAFFVFRAQVFKLPRGAGYYEPEADGYLDAAWDERPLYYSGELPIPEESRLAMWRALRGTYDEHPEVAKLFH